MHESFKGKEQLIVQLRNETKKRGSYARNETERGWYQKILFYAGHQWIYYNGTTKRWTNIDSYDLPDWYPRPVTNKFARSADALKSLLLQKEPRYNIRPADDSEEAMAVAEIGDALVDITDEEAGMKECRRSLAAWFVITGTVIAHNYYHISPDNGYIQIPIERCNDCSELVPPDKAHMDKCSFCESESLGEAVDEQGNQVVYEMEKGRLETEAVSPFEIYLDQELGEFSKCKVIVRSIQRNADDLKKDYPKIADKISHTETVEIEDSNAAMYNASLAYVTTGLGSQWGEGAQDSGNKKATLDYVYAMPNKDFPQGLIAVLSGDNVIESEPLSELYSDYQGRPFLPFALRPLKTIPGRIWGKTPMDDVVSKQYERNRYDSFAQLQFFTTAAGNWLVPENCEVSPITGEPGKKLTYKPLAGMPQVKPEKIPGQELTQSYFKLVEMIDRDIEDLVATYDVLKGNSPENVRTFGGQKLLYERAYSSHLEMITNWELLHQEIKRQHIEIARKHFVEERRRVIQNQAGEWETDVFTRADLTGGLIIRVEMGSTMPKSQAAEISGIFESISMGLVNIQDEKVRFKVLERLGQADLLGDLEEDFKDARREWKEFVKSVEDFPELPVMWKTRPRLGIDNELMHYMDALSRAKTPEFFELDERAQRMWEEHIIYHKTNVEQAQMAQMMMAGPQKPAPKPPAPKKRMEDQEAA